MAVFFEEPGESFFVSSLFQHTHTDTLCICVSIPDLPLSASDAGEVIDQFLRRRGWQIPVEHVKSPSLPAIWRCSCGVAAGTTAVLHNFTGNVAPRWRFFHILSFSLSFPFPFPFIILSFPFLFPFLSLSHSPFLSLSFPFPFRSLSCLFYFFSLFFSFPFPFPCGSYANFKPPCKTRLII